MQITEALRLLTACAELNTPNGVQVQPKEWPKNNLENIDYEAIARIGNGALRKARKQDATLKTMQALLAGIGCGTNEPINGGDAVDLLNRINELLGDVGY